VPNEEDQTSTPAATESPLSGRLSALLRELAYTPDAQVDAAWDGALDPGAVIGRFELLQEIGRGAFGIVYKARDRDLGRLVAFKAVRPGARPDVREERLLREAEAAARLSHPNLVTLFDVGRSEHGPYLVLELLQGRTLNQRMGQGPIGVHEALGIAVEVAKGVAHAHANGVVHRDLTPANVFLCDDGQVKVLDLGMAHAFGRRRVDGGTPGYMAPEQRRGAPEDERTDVFALGVILFRMLAGELPFPERAGRSGGPVPVLDIPGAPSLGDLVARMLDQDPVNRPRDAGRVLAELAVLRQELERTRSAPRPALARKRRRRRPLVAALVALGVLAGVAAAGWATNWLGRRIVPTAARTPDVPSIAVLPFADVSPRGDQEYFSDGLTDEILNALASVEGLRVPGRTSSFYFKGKSAKLADIGRELKVGAVLEGSVRRAGNRVRVTAQIVSVADGYRQWTQTYDRELTDIFAVQDDIARAVVEALDVKLLGGRAPSVRSHAAENPEVYAQYLLGRQQYYRYTMPSLRLAVAAYQKALALDPSYAPAWAGLGAPLYHLAGQAETPAAVATQRRRALDAAEKAVALSPDLAEALSARGILRALVEYDWLGAKADLERAMALNPNDADGRRRYGVLLYDLGRLPEAIAEVRKAVDLDPLGPSWSMLGMLYQAAGDLGAAEAAFRRHLRIAPDALPALLGIGRNLLLQSKPKEASAVFENCPGEDDRLWGKAAVEHALGHPDASRAALDELISRYAHASAFGIAEVYAWRGEKDPAFEWLERGFAGHASGMAGEFRTDPFLRALRDDPRFEALLRKLNLPAGPGPVPVRRGKVVE
jgi:TolB-like protein/Tfp pilus assembly protein PilF